MVTPPTIVTPEALECRICHARYPVEPLTICEECFGPLEPAYDLDAIDGDRLPQAGRGRGRRACGATSRCCPAGRISSGSTSAPGSRRCAARTTSPTRLGLERLWIKDDSVNPSNSFKDRVVSVATTMSRAFGFEAICCASTGNLANATAAHAAKAGIPCFVFVPDDLERAKIIATEVYGAKVVAVKGNYDDVNRLCSEVAETLPWAFVNVNMRPFYAEGSKSLGFEAAEQLGWRLPDHVVVPIASGALLTKMHRAFQELMAIGAVEAKPYRVSGAQPEGCRPVAQAFQDGAETVDADEAQHDRALAGDRLARRRHVRDAGGARDRRPHRVVHRGRDPRGDRRCSPKPRACSPRPPAA